MPDWGLTRTQRENGPWGLPARALSPGKIYTDPVHGDVYLTVLEQWIVDSPPFQRLRRVRQLGTTHLVYPGATHTRFSHALGAVRVAQDLLDAISSQRDALHPIDDLFAQWESEHDPEYVAEHLARATVQARLGALLHDLGHVPFGHSIEDDREILARHDENYDRFRRLWEEIREFVPRRLERDVDGVAARADVREQLRTLLDFDGVLHRELEPLIVSSSKKVKRVDDLEYPFVADLVGNTICADLLDYLLRDHLYTGLPAGLGHRFLSGFFVVPDDHGIHKRHLALNIMRDGHERPDVISELLKALRYRYELSERALTHKAKLAADVMVSKALEDWAAAIWLEKNSQEVGRIDDHAQLLEADDLLSLRARLLDLLRRERGRGPKKAEEAMAAFDARSGEAMEDLLLARGDDGLLEYLREGSEPSVDARVGACADRLRARSARLAGRLLVRDLYQIGGRATLKGASAKALYESYGSAEARARLERRAAEFAELADRSKVLIWVPDPTMRMKPAGVLVDDGQTVKPFFEYEGKGRGEEIYRAHRDLWAIWTFVDRDLTEDETMMVLTFLAGELGVSWERMEQFRTRPGEWLTELAVVELTPDGAVGDVAVADQVARLPEFAARDHATFRDYVRAVERRLSELAEGESQ